MPPDPRRIVFVCEAIWQSFCPPQRGQDQG